LRVAVIFEDFLILEKQRYSAYNLQQFIADCGGLLGLFMGCSLLSIVEIFYHVTLNFMANRKKSREAKVLAQVVA